jgi:HK97 family phage portal protein
MSIIGTILADTRSGGVGAGDGPVTNPQNPAFWLQKLFYGGTETWSGESISPDTALTISAYWNAINIIAGAIGFLPFVVYERDGRNRNSAVDHPVYTIIPDRPNPYMDALTFRETIQAHVLGWGNGYAEIERAGHGGPKYLWPISPAKVTPEVYTPKGGQETVRYKYVNGSKTKWIDYDNMYHIKGLGFEGLSGYSIINYMKQSLGLVRAVEKYGSRFFKNNATPPAVLEHPKTLGDDAEKHLRKSWEEIHKSPENAGRIAILEEGMKLHQIGIPPEDAQYLLTRKFSVTEIARWFDIPPHMLKDLDKATFSNIEHQGIEFVVWTLTRWMKRWEQETNYKLFGKEARRKYYSEFVPAALLRGDTKSRYEAYRIAIFSGWINRNKARELENMNPAEGLDDYLQPMNYKVVGEPDPRTAGAARTREIEPTPEPPALPADQVGDVRDQGGDPGDQAADVRDQGGDPGDRAEDTAGQDRPTGPEGDRDSDNGFQALFESTFRRIVTKEVNALKRIVKKQDEPDTRAERVNEFYDKHMDHVRDVLEPVLRVFGADDQAIEIEAQKYIDDSRADLLAGLRYWDPDEILDDWKETKALKMTEEILGRGKDG